jgi:hypothetical protein
MSLPLLLIIRYSSIALSARGEGIRVHFVGAQECTDFEFVTRNDIGGNQVCCTYTHKQNPDYSAGHESVVANRVLESLKIPKYAKKAVENTISLRAQIAASFSGRDSMSTPVSNL